MQDTSVDCELCGKPTKESIKITLDGIEMVVCGTCAKGKLQVSQEKRIEKLRELGFKMHDSVKKNDSDEVELVDNFRQLLQKQRNSMNLTFEELALKLQERDSVLRKVESGKFPPDAKLIKKLERFFGIKLTE